MTTFVFEKISNNAHKEEKDVWALSPLAALMDRIKDGRVADFWTFPFL